MNGNQTNRDHWEFTGCKVSLVACEIGSVKYDSVLVQIINELFVNTKICLNIKQDILV
jgi:hypothetical protein